MLSNLPNIYESTGNDIRARRLALGLSQRELGKFAGCSGQNIVQVEQDYSRQSTPRVIGLAIILEACKSKEVLVLFKRKELVEQIRVLERKNATLKTFILTELMGRLSMPDLEKLDTQNLEDLMLALMHNHIRQFRKSLDLKVADVAKMMNLARQTVSKIETRGSPEALMNEFRTLKNYKESKEKEDNKE